MLNAFLFQLAAAIAYIFVLYLGVKKRLPWARQIWVALMFGYVTVLISITLFPVPIQQEVIKNLKEIRPSSNNYVPLASIVEIVAGGSLLSIVRNVIGNVVLFMPMGFLVPLLFAQPSPLRHTALVGLFASIAVETLQFGLSFVVGPYRSVDIDDIILNTLGTITGFLVLRFITMIVSNFRNVRAPS